MNEQQRRQLVDARQVFETYRSARALYAHSFSGSMRWLTRKGRDYLHRKRGASEISLGSRGPETEGLHRAFIEGRRELKERLAVLSVRLDEMAPVNRALNLGRVPRLTARVLRRLDDKGLLGSHLLVVGTNALFCYESAAGVLLDDGLVATGDADLLWDARQRLALVLPEVRRSGLLELLKRTDRSFALRAPNDFRAVNSDGFFVDLIRPEDHSFFGPAARKTIGEPADDLHGAPIFGLQWLVNAPKFEAIAVGADGYPVRMVTPDPRALSLHKLWISEQPRRDPVKQRRDRTQAAVVAAMCQTYFALRFDDEELRALPRRLRELIGVDSVEPSAPSGEDDEPPTPDW